ncbi:hypothetical protein SCHPADRAFT_721707 [Schizopora paradoxa]|uniref:Uncharacterized protein n=1 Tax=Schizopora paradoxa TaxID=27342 RepID=A0A0H2R7T2_9AGAM|nr:hypothetical protein SCHPADRAFT_721707 [Schizopora paradoxa]
MLPQKHDIYYLRRKMRHRGVALLPGADPSQRRFRLFSMSSDNSGEPGATIGQCQGNRPDVIIKSSRTELRFFHPQIHVRNSSLNQCKVELDLILDDRDSTLALVQCQQLAPSSEAPRQVLAFFNVLSAFSAQTQLQQITPTIVPKPNIFAGVLLGNPVIDTR